MLPVQEIQINTKNNRVFSVHLEKWATHFECKSPTISAVTFATNTTVHATYQDMILYLRHHLAKLDPTDAISVVENPCNTEFVSAPEQKQIHTAIMLSVIVKVNGIIV